MRVVRVALVLLALVFASGALAEFSLILSTVVPSGAEKVDSYSQSGIYQAATGLIDKVALQVGEVCISHEVYLYDGSYSLYSESLLLESFATDYHELARTSDGVVFEANGGLGGVALGYWLQLDSGALVLMLCQT